MAKEKKFLPLHSGKEQRTSHAFRYLFWGFFLGTLFLALNKKQFSENNLTSCFLVFLALELQDFEHFFRFFSDLFWTYTIPEITVGQFIKIETSFLVSFLVHHRLFPLELWYCKELNFIFYFKKMRGRVYFYSLGNMGDDIHSALFLLAVMTNRRLTTIDLRRQSLIQGSSINYVPFFRRFLFFRVCGESGIIHVAQC